MSTAEIWMLVLNAIMAIGGLGALIVGLIALNKKAAVSITPQPLEVRVTEELHRQFAAKDEFHAHVRETKAEFARMTQQRSEDLRLAADSRRVMYGKQDDLRRELTERTDTVVSELREALDEKHKENTKRLDDMPERIIATLRNTGAIGGNHD